MKTRGDDEKTSELQGRDLGHGPLARRSPWELGQVTYPRRPSDLFPNKMRKLAQKTLHQI